MRDEEMVAKFRAANLENCKKRRLVQRHPEALELLRSTVRILDSLWDCIHEHERHIEVLRECIGDEGLRLCEKVGSESLGDRIDAMDALEWHGGMTFRDWSIAIDAAKRRRDGDDEE